MQNLYLLICLQLIFIFKLNVQIWGGIPRCGHFPNSAFLYSFSNFPFIMPRSNFFIPEPQFFKPFLQNTALLPYKSHSQKKQQKNASFPHIFFLMLMRRFSNLCFSFQKCFTNTNFVPSLITSVNIFTGYDRLL